MNEDYEDQVVRWCRNGRRTHSSSTSGFQICAGLLDLCAKARRGAQKLGHDRDPHGLADGDCQSRQYRWRYRWQNDPADRPRAGLGEDRRHFQQVAVDVEDRVAHGGDEQRQRDQSDHQDDDARRRSEPYHPDHDEHDRRYRHEDLDPGVQQLTQPGPGAQGPARRDADETGQPQADDGSGQSEPQGPSQRSVVDQPQEGAPGRRRTGKGVLGLVQCGPVPDEDGQADTGPPQKTCAPANEGRWQVRGHRGSFR